MNADAHVRFEPVGIDIEASEDETVLDAAFRQGVMLMHGCKEGQCSACKSFLLDGDARWIATRPSRWPTTRATRVTCCCAGRTPTPTSRSS